MASTAFQALIEEVYVYKFGEGAIGSASPKNSINIAAQVLEINMFESIFSPVIRAEITVNDAIGLFANFPLTGEEIIKISYKTEKAGDQREELMIIESVQNIAIADDSRSMIYIINAISLEAWANARRTVQRAYQGDITDAVKSIFNEYIEKPIKQVLPSFKTKPFFSFPSVEQQKIVVIPAHKPFAAINMLSKIITPRSNEAFSYMFYQNKNGYHFKSLQDMFGKNRTYAARRAAKKNGYKYISDEVEESERMSNDNRIVTNITYNRRHSTLDKISGGYFQNRLFEINMAQKSYFVTETKPDEVINIENNKLNTTKYLAITPIDDGEEASNRTNYVINNQKENDLSYPVSERRERWGKDIIAHLALSQIDITVTIPGDPKLDVGELFYMEVAKIQGFNINDEDELISGFFLITEKRDTINQKGEFATSLRIQKDSYNSSVNFDSKYNPDAATDSFIGT